MTKMGRLAQDLYDLQVAAMPRECSRNELMKGIGIVANPAKGPTQNEIVFFHEIKGYLQDILAVTDVVTMVGRRVAGNQGWMYSLQGGPTHPVSKEYMIEKTRGLFKRHKRSYAVMTALSAGISGSTTEGRYIRRLQRTAYRALEDTVDVLAELGVSAPSLPPAPKRYP